MILKQWSFDWNISEIFQAFARFLYIYIRKNVWPGKSVSHIINLIDLSYLWHGHKPGCLRIFHVVVGRGMVFLLGSFGIGWNKRAESGVCQGVCWVRRRSYLHVAHSSGDERKLLRNPFYQIGMCVCVWRGNKVPERSKDKVLNIWEPGPCHTIALVRSTKYDVIYICIWCRYW